MKHIINSIKNFITKIIIRPFKKFIYPSAKKYVLSPMNKFAFQPIRKYVLLPVKKYVLVSIFNYVLLPFRKYVIIPIRSYVLAPLNKYIFSPLNKHVLSPYLFSPIYKYVLKPIIKFFVMLYNIKWVSLSYTHVVVFERFKIRRTNKRTQAITGLSFIFIWIVGYLIFAFYPVINSFYLSFFKVRLAADGINQNFVLFNNYRAAFLSDTEFVEKLINYVLSMLLNVPVTIVFALIIAMLINQNIKGKGIWRTIFFLPVIIASGPVIGELMNQGATTLPSIDEYQFIDLIVNNVGSFLADPIQALFDQILFVLWFAGIQILIFLAGLQKIDKSIYEASMIDGASPWESFWKITLPSIKPLITISIIYTVVSMSVFSLNEVTVFIKGKFLSPSTDALTNGYGYMATLSIIYFIVMALIILIFVGALNIRGRKDS